MLMVLQYFNWSVFQSSFSSSKIKQQFHFRVSKNEPSGTNSKVSESLVSGDFICNHPVDPLPMASLTQAFSRDEDSAEIHDHGYLWNSNGRIHVRLSEAVYTIDAIPSVV